jgi:hypothetical protein
VDGRHASDYKDAADSRNDAHKETHAVEVEWPLPKRLCKGQARQSCRHAGAAQVFPSFRPFLNVTCLLVHHMVPETTLQRPRLEGSHGSVRKPPEVGYQTGR